MKDITFLSISVQFVFGFLNMYIFKLIFGSYYCQSDMFGYVKHIPNVDMSTFGHRLSTCTWAPYPRNGRAPAASTQQRKARVIHAPIQHRHDSTMYRHEIFQKAAYDDDSTL